MAIRDVLIKGRTLLEVGPPLGILAGYLVIAFGVLTAVDRKHRL